MVSTDLSNAVKGGGWRWTIVDGWTLVRRNLNRLKHSPGEIIGTLLAPIIMIIMFGYIFGSAIPVPGGGNYREYLIPGLFAMSSTFSVMATLQRVAADNGKGVMDRYRSMPMARSAVPFGHTGADLIMHAIGTVLMMLCGLAVGWRIRDGLLDALAAFGLLLLFAYALMWVGVFFGLMTKNEETADRVFPIVMPITMISNAFVPTGGMPVWLQAIADWNPVSAVVAASRELFGNPGVVTSTAWPLQHPVLATLGWSLALLVVFVPLAVYRYRTAGR
ncbi:MAG: ABC transporter permease [Streptosporangiales bacterium]